MGTIKTQKLGDDPPNSKRRGRSAGRDSNGTRKTPNVLAGKGAAMKGESEERLAITHSRNQV